MESGIKIPPPCVNRAWFGRLFAAPAVDNQAVSRQNTAGSGHLATTLERHQKLVKLGMFARDCVFQAPVPRLKYDISHGARFGPLGGAKPEADGRENFSSFRSPDSPVVLPSTPGDARPPCTVANCRQRLVSSGVSLEPREMLPVRRNSGCGRKAVWYNNGQDFVHEHVHIAWGALTTRHRLL
jgi:hypothetical protein